MELSGQATEMGGQTGGRWEEGAWSSRAFELGELRQGVAWGRLMLSAMSVANGT